MEDGGGVHYALDKDGVIDNKATCFQFSVGHKLWTSTGNVHIRFWLSECGTHWVWLEGIDNIPASYLVDELEGDLVYEWPLEDVVKLSTHHHKEQ